MKKVYMKPEIEVVSIVSQEPITAEGEVVDGSMGLVDSDGIVWE